MGACLALMLCGQAALARDITIVVQRLDRGAELFLSAPAPQLFELLNPDAAQLVPTEHDHISFGAFWRGTWGIGDALLSGTDVSIGNTPAAFEAMSFMLHPKSETVPLNDRYDALMAISVCNTVEPGAQYQMSDMVAYVGFYSEVPSDTAPVHITLPIETMNEALTINVLDIAQDGRTTKYTTTRAAGSPAQITLDVPNRPVAMMGITAFGFAGFLSILGLSLLWRRKSPQT